MVTLGWEEIVRRGTGAGMTLVTFRWLQPSLEMERSRRMVFVSRESGVSGAGWERHRKRSRLAC